MSTEPWLGTDSTGEGPDKGTLCLPFSFGIGNMLDCERNCVDHKYITVFLNQFGSALTAEKSFSPIFIQFSKQSESNNLSHLSKHEKSITSPPFEV